MRRHLHLWVCQRQEMMGRRDSELTSYFIIKTRYLRKLRLREALTYKVHCVQSFRLGVLISLPVWESRKIMHCWKLLLNLHLLKLRLEKRCKRSIRFSRLNVDTSWFSWYSMICSGCRTKVWQNNTFEEMWRCHFGWSNHERNPFMLKFHIKRSVTLFDTYLYNAF